MIGIDIPGYEITQLIGRGGMASVWKARQVSLDRIVAIKILGSTFSDEASDVKQFHEEARHTAQLRHHGIVQVFDAGAHAGLYYFVMEFVDGYTIGEWLRRKEMLPERDALAVAECVADAMAYAWDECRMVHCDIKPDNILVDSDGTVKVADLGLSRTLNAMNRSDLHQEEDVLGTPMYMSPEQARAEGNLDCRADMYSLGSMLYELVTGKRLFPGIDVDEIMTQQCSGQAPAPHEINPKISTKMSELIELLLAKDKAHRPGDWGLVCKLIRRVQRNQQLPVKLPARAVSTVRRRTSPRSHRKTSTAQRNMRRWKRSDETKTIQVVVGLVILAILAIVFFGMQQSQMSPPKRQRSQRTVRAPRRTSGASTRSATKSKPPSEQVRQVRSKPEPVRPAMLEEMSESAKQWQTMARWIELNPNRPGEAVWRIKRLLPSLIGTACEARARSELARLAAIQAALDEKEAERVVRIEADHAQQEAARQPSETRDEPEEVVAEKDPAAERRARLLEARRAFESLKVVLPADEEDVVELTHKEKSALDAARSSSLVPPRVAKNLLRGSWDEAERLTAWWERKVKSKKYAPLVGDLLSDLESLNRMDARILKSFDVQRGDVIEVGLFSGDVKVMVDEVTLRSVKVTRRGAGAGKGTAESMEFRVADLSTHEKLTRMGSDEDSDVALAKGLLAYQCGAYEHARRYFVFVSPLLSEELLKSVSGAGR